MLIIEEEFTLPNFMEWRSAMIQFHQKGFKSALEWTAGLKLRSELLDI